MRAEHANPLEPTAGLWKGSHSLAEHLVFILIYNAENIDDTTDDGGLQAFLIKFHFVKHEILSTFFLYFIPKSSKTFFLLLFYLSI